MIANAKTVMVLTQIQPGVDWERWWTGAFGPDFCGTSSIYAVSHAGELADGRATPALADTPATKSNHD